MDQSTLVFVFVATLQAVVFGFSLLLIKRTKSDTKSVANYTVDAATKLAELEGTCNSLRLEFTEVIDRLERWSRRDKMRETKATKPLGDVLPTDKDLMPGLVPGNNDPLAPGVVLTPMQKLRISKGR